MTKYYKVVAKCGHVGKKHYVPVAFAIAAESGKEAAKIARLIPRVKHDHNDAILDCKEFSYEEYVELNEINNNDEYLKFRSRQEQNLIDLSGRIEDDNHYDPNLYRHIPSKKDKEKRRQRIAYKKKREKNQFNRSNRLVGAC